MQHGPIADTGDISALLEDFLFSQSDSRTRTRTNILIFWLILIRQSFLMQRNNKLPMLKIFNILSTEIDSLKITELLNKCS